MKSKYGNYIIYCDGFYYIYEQLTDCKEHYTHFTGQRKWSFERFRTEVYKRHVIATRENSYRVMIYDPCTEVRILSHDAFIKHLGHQIYLNKKWGGDPYQQRVFYHKKGDTNS